MKTISTPRLSTVPPRLQKTTVQPRHSSTGTSNIYSKQTTAGKSTCSCLSSLTDVLKTWENNIQAKLDAIQQKIDENQKIYHKNMKDEISNLRSTLEPLIAVRNSTLLATTTTKAPLVPATTANSSSQQGSSHLTHQNLCNYNNSQTYSSLNLNLIDNNNNRNKNNIKNKNNSNFNFNDISINDNSNNNNHNNSSDNNSNSHLILHNNHSTKHEHINYGYPLNLSFKNTHPNQNHTQVNTHPYNNSSLTNYMESYEIYIAGFMPLSLEDNLTGLCYSILHGISDTFNISEITNVRLLHTNASNEASAQPSVTGHPPLIVRLSTISRTKQILSLKRLINYYNTRDLDLSHLGEDFTTRVPATKLILNEVLTATEYQRFKSLRKHAKNLGFKYVWHTGGNSLTRWDRSSRAHIFNSLTDIDSIKLQQNYNSEIMTDTREKTDVTAK